MADELKEPMFSIVFILGVIIVLLLSFGGFFRQGKLVDEKIDLIKPYMSTNAVRSILGDPLSIFKDERDPDIATWQYYSISVYAGTGGTIGAEKLILVFKNNILVGYSYNYDPDFIARFKGRKPVIRNWRGY